MPYLSAFAVVIHSEEALSILNVRTFTFNFTFTHSYMPISRTIQVRPDNWSVVTPIVSYMPSIFLTLTFCIRVLAVLWSRDHGLETRVHSSSFCPGLGHGLETWRSRSRSWSRDLKVQVSVLVSRPEGPGLGLGLETWWPRSRSWSQDLKNVLTTTLATNIIHWWQVAQCEQVVRGVSYPHNQSHLCCLPDVHLLFHCQLLDHIQNQQLQHLHYNTNFDTYTVGWVEGMASGL